MFIEATEILRCPQPHDESYLICGPVTMDGRDVVRGGLICPQCRAEYPIVDRIAWFAPPAAQAGAPRTAHPAPSESLTATAVQTFLDLQGGGGYLLLVGSAGRLAADLAALLPQTALVCVNPPASAALPTTVTVLRSPAALPVRRHSVRAVVLGADASGEPWLTAGIGAVLTGLRLVVEDETVQPPGVVELARGAGVFVGERRAS